jgi:hypothetical protein
LLRGGALPDGQRACSLAAHGRGERNRAVGEQLARRERLAQVLEGLRVDPKRDSEEDDRALFGRGLVGEALDLGVRHLLAEPAGRLGCAIGATRADHNRMSGPRPSQREAVAQRAGAADDRDGVAGGAHP